MISKMKFISQILSGILSGIFVASLLCACNGRQDSGPRAYHVSASGIATSESTAPQKAEDYGKAAEALLTAQGFEQAHELSKLGLQQDAKNLKSGFIYAVTSVLLTQKGILARVRPLAEKNVKAKESIDRQLAKIRAEPRSAVNEFLLNGKPDISSEAQLQEYFDSLIEALEILRSFAKANKDSEITIKGTTEFFSALIERYAKSCEIRETEKWEYELVCPEATSRYDVTFNRADFEGLIAMSSFYQIYFGMINAYEMTGVVKLVNKYDGQEGLRTQILVDELLQESAFGRLRSHSKIHNTRSLGLDAVGALNWAIKNQATICPKGVEHPTNRMGKMMNKGICVHPLFRPMIDSMESIFKGDLIDSKTAQGDSVYRGKVAPMAFFDHPPTDLRNLGPFKFDPCNQLQSIGDTTLAGYFPNGDANVVIPMQAKKCEK